jgi:hypothetical protein
MKSVWVLDVVGEVFGDMLDNICSGLAGFQSRAQPFKQHLWLDKLAKRHEAICSGLLVASPSRQHAKRNNGQSSF